MPDSSDRSSVPSSCVMVRRHSYITKELPALLRDDSAFSSLNTDCASIMGHSMGGHGALTIGLKNPEAYRSISALAPMCNVSVGPSGSEGNILHACSSPLINHTVQSKLLKRSLFK